MDRRLLAAGAAIAILVALIAALLPQYLYPPAPAESRHTGRHMGLRQERTIDGSWNIFILSSVYTFDELRLMVTNASTGATTLDVKLTAIAPGKNHPDAMINDCYGDGKLGAGDSVTLKGTSPNIQPGYKVQFLIKENVVGSIRELL